MTQRRNPRWPQRLNRTTKLCYGCNRTLALEAFGKNNRNSDGLQTRCRECVNVAQNDYIKRKREQFVKRVAEARRESATIKARANNPFSLAPGAAAPSIADLMAQMKAQLLADRPELAAQLNQPSQQEAAPCSPSVSPEDMEIELDMDDTNNPWFTP